VLSPTFRDKGDAWTASDATLLDVILGLGPSSAAIPAPRRVQPDLEKIVLTPS
jgi:hypothetical protein